jgi:hypothetical protein
MSTGSPTFTLTGASPAIAYRFRCDTPCGWAICTVNDATGELSIQSDFGNWAYRWNVAHLGEPTLTAFIGSRPHVHYLLGKLTAQVDKQIDPTATIAECRAKVVRARRDNEVTRTCAREAYDWLTESADDLDSSADLWMERMPSEVWNLLGSAPYEYIRHEPTPGARVLRDGILPALIEVCAVAVATSTSAAEASP